MVTSVSKRSVPRAIPVLQGCLHLPNMDIRADAMRREFQNLINNDTSGSADLPIRRRHITAKWVYAWKANQLGEVTQG